MREELKFTQQVIADANGTATTLPVGPVMYRETWKVTRYSINVSEGRAKFRMYRDYVDPQQQIDETDSGESDTSENNSIELQVGGKLVGQWVDATPGAACTLVLYGEKYR